MSTLVSKQLAIDYDNVKTYLTANTGMSLAKSILFLGNVACAMKGTTECSAYINTAGMKELYPNDTAHPVKADILMRCMSYRSILAPGKSYLNFRFNGTSVLNGTSSASSYADYSVTGSTDAAITGSNRNSDLTFCLRGDASSTQGVMLRGSVTLYFNCYDCKAVAGAEISSVSVSSATGFDGDRITYSCSIQSGAKFVGWYNGSTLVSASQTYSHTVSGTDVTLTAVAAIPKNLLSVYYGSQKLIDSEIAQEPVPVTYAGTTITTVASGGTKTLQCAGTVMVGNVGIKGYTLKCAGKLMAENIIVHNTEGG